MNKGSQIKTNRRPNPSGDYDFEPLTFRNFLAPIAFLLGLLVVSLGIGTCGTNRWGREGHLSPHHWFILPGVALILFALWRHGKGE